MSLDGHTMVDLAPMSMIYQLIIPLYIELPPMMPWFIGLWKTPWSSRQKPWFPVKIFFQHIQSTDTSISLGFPSYSHWNPLFRDGFSHGFPMKTSIISPCSHKCLRHGSLNGSVVLLPVYSPSLEVRCSKRSTYFDRLVDPIFCSEKAVFPLGKTHQAPVWSHFLRWTANCSTCCSPFFHIFSHWKPAFFPWFPLDPQGGAPGAGPAATCPRAPSGQPRGWVWWRCWPPGGLEAEGMAEAGEIEKSV